MKPNTTRVTIPALSDSSTLAKFQTTGDPVVILKMTGVGNNQPYDYRAGDKTFRFRWLSEQQGHILRVPLALWMQNKAKLAHELMDQRHLSHPIIAMIEMPAVATADPEANLIQPLLDALVSDPDFAWSWHCNIAMALYDAEQGKKDPAVCNAGAALFLSRLTDGRVDTTIHPAYADTQGGEPVAETPITAAPATTPESPEMGAADTNPAQNVVGLSVEPTAAPAVETLSDTDVAEDEGEDANDAATLAAEMTHDDDSASESPTAEQVAGTAALSDLAYDICDAPRRIKALASLLGVDESKLREAIDLPESRVEVTGPGWVRRKESQPA